MALRSSQNQRFQLTASLTPSNPSTKNTTFTRLDRTGNEEKNSLSTTTLYKSATSASHQSHRTTLTFKPAIGTSWLGKRQQLWTMFPRAQHPLCSAGFTYLSSCNGFRVAPCGKREPGGSAAMPQRVNGMVHEVTSCIQVMWSQIFYQPLMKGGNSD